MVATVQGYELKADQYWAWTQKEYPLGTKYIIFSCKRMWNSREKGQMISNKNTKTAFDTKMKRRSSRKCSMNSHRNSKIKRTKYFNILRMTNLTKEKLLNLITLMRNSERNCKRIKVNLLRFKKVQLLLLSKKIILFLNYRKNWQN